MSLGEAIDHYLKSHRMYGRFMGQKVVSLWPEVMGTAIAKHTVDLQISQRVLLVKLDSAVLRKELDMGKERIVFMLNEAAGAQVINSIRFL
jgi:predicted nucleic acid-binding Zn ribbon protein